MNVKATLTNERAVKENGGGTVCVESVYTLLTANKRQQVSTEGV
jgi:hypothetical protein